MTMSGQQLTATTPEHATATAQAVLKALDLTSAKLESIRDPKKFPMERLVSAIHAGHYFGPVHDGHTLPDDPFSPTAPPLSAKIPMILGNTLDETRLLIGGSNPALFSLTWTQLPVELEHYRQFLGDLTTAEIIDAYRLWYPGYDASDVFFAATTAFRSWHGMIIESERRAAQNGPTWAYNFTWKSPVDGGKWGAPHTIDIPFAFDNLAIAASMTGTSPEAQQLAASYADTLIHFAHTGEPNHSGLPHWPRYNTTHRPTMLWDSTPRVENDPRGEERKLIAQARYLQPGT
jgi:para-nitrobenzyl esterase